MSIRLCVGAVLWWEDAQEPSLPVPLRTHMEMLSLTVPLCCRGKLGGGSNAKDACTGGLVCRGKADFTSRDLPPCSSQALCNLAVGKSQSGSHWFALTAPLRLSQRTDCQQGQLGLSLQSPSPHPLAEDLHKPLVTPSAQLGCTAVPQGPHAVSAVAVVLLKKGTIFTTFSHFDRRKVKTFEASQLRQQLGFHLQDVQPSNLSPMALMPGCLLAPE